MRRILANIFISEINIPQAGLLTITNVKVSDNLKFAKIYVSFLNNKINVSELLSIIISKKKLIRYYVSARLKLKYIPELRFYYDDSFEYAENIDKLINKIHKND